MRSKIFTDLERQILRAFVNGENPRGPNWDKLRWRFKAFTVLAQDVELYVKVKEKLRQSS